ncbi:SpoIIE family protein phosphatase [Odoribacter sp. OttesenSCG-928-A06]|nr:SpoIIE family protein phosphatase [Odoribacter sp. OttesenSCG-928-A06]
MQDRLQYVSENIFFKTNKLFSNIEKIPNNFSWLMTDYIVHPDSISGLTRKIVESNPEILSCIIAFEPNHFPSKGNFFAPYTYTKDDRELVTTLLNPSDEMGKDYYYDMDWYRIPQKQHKSLWNRARYNIEDLNRNVINYSTPVFNPKKEFIGVLSVALATEWVANLLVPYTEYEGSFPVVVNDKGDYILAGNHYPFKNKSLHDLIENMEDPQARVLADEVLSRKQGECILDNPLIHSYVLYAPIENTPWNLILVYPYNQAFQNVQLFKNTLVVSFVVLLFLVCLVSFILIRRLTKPLKALALSARMISEGELNVSLPDIKNEYEMKVIYNSFEYMQKKVKKYLENIEQTESSKIKFDRDLTLAHNIQMGLLTKNFSPLANKDVDFFAATYPVHEVGGDFYDYSISGNHLCFIIGDVSGKGVSASILMGVTMSLFRSIPTKQLHPAYIANFLNQNITAYNEADMFVTIFIGVLNIQTRSMRYCNAGQPAPLILHKERNSTFINTYSDLPLGIDKEHKYEEHKFHFSDGEGVLFYTDGVTDSQNCKKDFFSDERLKSIVTENKNLPSKDLIDKVVANIYEYQGKCEQTDDFTLLSIKANQDWFNNNEE